ncbi:L-fucose:H+ symporter permease [Pedobacter antarcticus]|uniref:Fucose permease n=2 Tax=Pedobacter antarcticus TaxID=34086 RepID=A0A081PHU0_9SPHI|nr:L-fucose:H+ symporter permease [Pedobacter antarcticus]KEQ30263.1 fucose permease [Pedobacter antarcticus 4BY]SDM81266.1 MFS transporter, FHS family, L-fucose permease [Pedobacter antarcticus]SFF36707.1 MFS transporter, FHS family, L-fucose permease [Pedobacter antarcticus]
MKKNTFAVSLIISLFFLWGFALNLNPILIPHLKKACQLTDTQSAFIDSASYIAYFLLAIPAGKVMKRFGYKWGIVIGLLLFAVGSFLFYPAASTRSYVFFLGALFIIASGLAFLETAANPYITVLGDPEGAAGRINFAQSFNGLAATLAPFLGGLFILSGESLSPEQEAAMSPAQLDHYLNMEASSVQIPFLIIGAVVLLVAVFLMRTPLPEIEESDQETGHEGSLLKHKNLMFGVVAEFFYVGAQVCISSFFIRFAEQVAGIAEKPAAMYLSGALLGFMVGRFIGTFLMRYVAPAKLLALYSLVNIVLVLAAVLLDGYASVYSLIGVLFFMSIMFPTIFSLSIRGLGSKTKEGSSLLIMAIVGGAVFPVIMGKLSDMTNIHLAYIVPVFAFIVIFFFALRNLGVKKLKLSQAH